MTLINDSPGPFAAGGAVAGADQMACDRLCCGAALVPRVPHLRNPVYLFFLHLLGSRMTQLLV